MAEEAQVETTDSAPASPAASSETQPQQSEQSKGAETQSSEQQTNGKSPTSLSVEAEEKPQAIPATWPDNWRELVAGEDKKALKTLERYQDVPAIWKAHSELRAKMDSADIREPKPKGKDEAQLASWRQNRNIPESPSGYYDGLPEGVVIDDDHRPITDRYFQFLHENDVGREEAMAGLQYMYAEEAAEIERLQENDRTNRQTCEDTLRAQLGSDYRPAMNRMHSMLDFYGQEGLADIMNEARLESGALIWDYPPFVTMMTGIARELMGDAVPLPQSGGTPQESIQSEIKQLEAKMANPKEWFNDHAGQQRLRELYIAEERMSARGG